MIVDEWNLAKEKTIRYFDNYPDISSDVIVKTKLGIFKARYQKWDWSDSSETPFFDFPEDHDQSVIAWRYE